MAMNLARVLVITKTHLLNVNASLILPTTPKPHNTVLELTSQSTGYTLFSNILRAVTSHTPPGIDLAGSPVLKVSNGDSSLILGFCKGGEWKPTAGGIRVSKYLIVKYGPNHISSDNCLSTFEMLCFYQMQPYQRYPSALQSLSTHSSFSALQACSSVVESSTATHTCQKLIGQFINYIPTRSKAELKEGWLRVPELLLHVTNRRPKAIDALIGSHFFQRMLTEALYLPCNNTEYQSFTKQVLNKNWPGLDTCQKWRMIGIWYHGQSDEEKQQLALESWGKRNARYKAAKEWGINKLQDEACELAANSDGTMSEMSESERDEGELTVTLRNARV
ncbi:hypothetical protein FRC12_008026 [Ceratobasidium sp. 428]|nr:hypothetical protein FRC12_008026 [Ceratobasidium sp. 428]